MELRDKLFGPNVEGLLEEKRFDEIVELASKDKRVVGKLGRALKDRRYDVRWRAAKALERIGRPAVELLIRVLKGRRSDMRCWAAGTLGEIGDERAVEPLLRAFKRSADWDVRRTIAQALGEIGDERAVEPLINAFMGHDHPVHRAAAEALVKIGKPAIEPLIHALKHRFPNTREEAAEVLGEIGDEKAVEPLISMLKDSGHHERVYPARALGKIGDERAVEPLISALGKWPDTREPIRLVGGKLVYHGVYDEFYERDRREVAKALVKVGKPAVEPLIGALSDNSSRVRMEAAWALGEMGDERTVEPLLSALKYSDDWGLRRMAGMALGKIGDERAVEPLVTALGDNARSGTDAAVAMACMAARALGKIGDERAVEPLISALRGGWSEWLKTQVAWALGEIGDERALPVLEAWIMHQDNPVMRSWAIRAEEKIKKRMKRMRRRSTR